MYMSKKREKYKVSHLQQNKSCPGGLHEYRQLTAQSRPSVLSSRPAAAAEGVQKEVAREADGRVGGDHETTQRWSFGFVSVTPGPPSSSFTSCICTLAARTSQKLSTTVENLSVAKTKSETTFDM